MGSPEAGQSLVRPCGRIGGVLLVRALLHLGTGLGRIAVLAQLLHEVLNVEAVGVAEQAHLGEDALDVRVRLLVIGEVPCLVLGHLFLGDAERRHTFAAVLDEIVVRLDLPVVGVDL